MDISTVILLLSVSFAADVSCSFTTNDSLLWPNGFVHYEFGKELTQAHVDLIMRALLVVQHKSCIEFIPASELRASPEDMVYLHFQYKEDVKWCSTTVGRTPNRSRFDKKRQEVTLGPWCVNGNFSRGRVLQVVLQTLGLYYETQRPDRDCFIEITNKDSTDFPTQQFTIEWDADISFPYDYWSVMQTKDAYRIYKELPPHKAVQVSMRQPTEPRTGTMSPMDARKVNYLYCGGVHPCKEPKDPTGLWTNSDQCEEEASYVMKNKCIPPPPTDPHS